MSTRTSYNGRSSVRSGLQDEKSLLVEAGLHSALVGAQALNARSHISRWRFWRRVHQEMAV